MQEIEDEWGCGICLEKVGAVTNNEPECIRGKHLICEMCAYRRIRIAGNEHTISC
jgi:hypothetical protein